MNLEYKIYDFKYKRYNPDKDYIKEYMCHLKCKVYDLSKDNDSELLGQLKEIRNKHGFTNEDVKKPIIFNRSIYRRRFWQYPFENINSKIMKFNPKRINCSEIRKLIETNQKEIILNYKDDDGKSRGVFYIGGQVSPDPYKRIVFYCEREELKNKEKV